MSDKPAFCPFVPDDPLCQDKPDTVEPIDGGDSGKGPMDPTTNPEKMDGGDHGDEKMHGNPMKGQLTFLGVAVGHAAYSGLNYFRYHHASDYYTYGDVLDTNYFSIGEHIHEYSGMAIWGLISITQLLSTLGFATEINMMAWAYGLMIYSLISLIGDLVLMAGRDRYYAVTETETYGSTDWISATLAQNYVEGALLEGSAFTLANHLLEHAEHENWMMAQMMNMCGAEMEDCPKDMKMDEKKMMDPKEDKAMLFRQAYFGF